MITRFLQSACFPILNFKPPSYSSNLLALLSSLSDASYLPDKRKPHSGLAPSPHPKSSFPPGRKTDLLSEDPRGPTPSNSFTFFLRTHLLCKLPASKIQLGSPINAMNLLPSQWSSSLVPPSQTLPPPSQPIRLFLEALT